MTDLADIATAENPQELVELAAQHVNPLVDPVNYVGTILAETRRRKAAGEAFGAKVEVLQRTEQYLERQAALGDPRQYDQALLFVQGMLSRMQKQGNGTADTYQKTTLRNLI